MTIAAESRTGKSGILMALITKIAVVLVPGTLRVELGNPSGMYSMIGSPQAVIISVTAAPGTGWIGGIVAGSAIL